MEGDKTNCSWLDSFAVAVDGGTNVRLTGSGNVTVAGKTSLFGDDVEMVSIRSVTFWKRAWTADLAFWLLSLVTLGLAPLLSLWHLPFFCSIRYARSSSSDPTAEFALVESLDEIFTLTTVDTLDKHGAGRGWLPVGTKGVEAAEGLPRSFEWRSERFWWHAGDETWVRFRFNIGAPIVALHQHAATCSLEDKAKEASPAASFWERRFLTYGSNILFIQIPSFFTLLGREVLKPFFVFQIFSFVLWFFFQQYYFYASLILVMSATSAMYEAFSTWRHYKNIKKLAELECMVTRLVTVPDAAGQPRLQAETISSSSLLPGDLLQLESGMVLPCDLVLLAGQCVVNEAMLTGESAPVLKTSLPLNAGDSRIRHSSEADSKYRLMSGTTVLQTRALSEPPATVPQWSPALGTPPSSIWCLAAPRPPPKKGLSMPVVAMVVGTGFSTAKGELVRAILFPKPSSYDFEKKLYYFIANLILFAVVACGITIAYQAGKLSPVVVLLNCLNIITITIPPALPLSLSVGLSIAFTRLSQHGVYCISPPRIINAGRVNTLCFDKTGTLTKDGLSMRGVLPVSLTHKTQAVSAIFNNFADDLRKLYTTAYKSFQSNPGSEPPPTLCLTQVLSACHSLSVLHPSSPSSFPELDVRRSSQVSSPGRRSSDEGAGGAWGWGQNTNYERTRIGSPGRTEPLKAYDAHSEYPDQDDDGASFIDTDGRLATFVGDPLEIQMFRSSGWFIFHRPDAHDDPSSSRISSHSDSQSEVWDNPNVPEFVDTVVMPPPASVLNMADMEGQGPAVEAGSDYMLVVMRRFDFDSEIRRMSVVVSTVPRGRGEVGQLPVQLSLLVKGAPETLQPLCDPATLPADFENRLHELALNGNRVLAAAARPLSGMTLEKALFEPRVELERNLTFVGFLVLENELKHETLGFLDKFGAAGLRSIMVTGDNPLTAIAVARKCGPHFLLRTRKTYLVDCPAGTASSGGTDADITESGGAGAAVPPDRTADAFPTNCVLKDLFGQRSIPLDDVLSGNPLQESPQLAPPSIGDPVPLLATPPLKGADLVVTGRAFESLKRHHEAVRGRIHGTSSLGSTTSASELMATFSVNSYSQPPTPLEAVLAHAGVFARMSAGDKAELVLALRDLGYSVCMTGDGANDSGALKAADVGVSIAAKQQVSPASSKTSATYRRSSGGAVGLEMTPQRKGKARPGVPADKDISVSAAPSIAAPFSTSSHHIGAVLQVLIEGRCTLVSAVTMFKYMFFYGVIQTMALVVLYPYLLELQENQYLWGDLALVFPMVFLMPAIPPKKELSRGLPESNLMAPSILLSTYGQTIFIIGFQLLSSTYLHLQDWFEQPTNRLLNMNSTVSFYFSSFQYSLLALTLSQSFGKFRKPLHQCYLLALILAVQFTLTSLFLLAPTEGILATFGLYDLTPYPSFCFRLWILALINGAVCCLFERFAVFHTSQEPDVLSLTRKSHEQQQGLGPQSEAERSMHERVRSCWEDSGGCLVPPCRPKGSLPRYACVLEACDRKWDRL